MLPANPVARRGVAQRVMLEEAELKCNNHSDYLCALFTAQICTAGSCVGMP